MVCSTFFRASILWGFARCGEQVGSQTDSSVRVRLNLRVTSGRRRVGFVRLSLVNSKAIDFTKTKGTGRAGGWPTTLMHLRHESNLSTVSKMSVEQDIELHARCNGLLRSKPGARK